MGLVFAGQAASVVNALGYGAEGQAVTPVSAAAPLPVTLASGAYADRSIPNLSGSSQQLMPANADRRVLIVHNIGTTAIAVNLTGGDASLTAGGSVNMAAGASMLLDHYPPSGAITVIGTANADVTAYEG